MDGRSCAVTGDAVNDTETFKAAWAHVETVRDRSSAKTSTTGANLDNTIWNLRGGIDGAVALDEQNLIVAGVHGRYGTINSDITSPIGKGKITSSGIGAGGSLTWFGQGGLYADAQAHVSAYNSNIHVATSNSTTSGNNGLGYAFGLEIGKKIDLGNDLKLTPQAQITRMAVDFENFTGRFGEAVALRSANVIKSRLGLAVDKAYRWVNESGKAQDLKIYGIGNVYYAMAGHSTVNVAGTNFEQKSDNFSAGLGLGVTRNFDDGKFSLFAEANAESAFRNSGSYRLAGTAGARAKW